MTTQPAPGEALLPPSSPAEDAHLLLTKFIADLPGAFEAAERLIGVDTGLLTDQEVAAGMTVTKLPTGAFFASSYDPARQYSEAWYGGLDTVDNVSSAALHARNTLYKALGVYRGFPGYAGKGGDAVPAGLIVLGVDDENPQQLSAYVYSLPEYSPAANLDEHDSLLHRFIGKGGRNFTADEYTSRLAGWVRENSNGSLAEDANRVNKLLNVANDPRTFAARVLGLAPEGGETAGPVRLVDRYLAGINKIAPDVPPHVREVVAALLTKYTPGHAEDQGTTPGTGGRLRLLAGSTVIQDGLAAGNDVWTPRSVSGRPVGRHHSLVSIASGDALRPASGAHAQEASGDAELAGDEATADPPVHISTSAFTGRELHTRRVNSALAEHILGQLNPVLAEQLTGKQPASQRGSEN